VSSQATRECWYRYIKLSEEEKKDFREKLDLISAEELGIDIPSSDGVAEKYKFTLEDLKELSDELQQNGE